MNEHIIPKQAPLVYKGVTITSKSELLSLTDMWKASGARKSQQPSEWLDSADGKRFREALAVLKPENSRFDLVKTVKGGRAPGTWGHWQIGLAYAKYLSPEFHMWCNQVVRERMEGRAVATASSLTDYDRQILGNMIKNCTGVVVKEQFDALVGQFLPAAVSGYIADHHLSIADGVTAGEACDLAKVAASYPRGLSGRVSRRLGLFCERNGEKPRITRLGRVRAQLFPTHLVREWLDIEGRALIKRWIEEKQGQRKLRLVGGEGA